MIALSLFIVFCQVICHHFELFRFLKIFSGSFAKVSILATQTALLKFFKPIPPSLFGVCFVLANNIFFVARTYLKFWNLIFSRHFKFCEVP